LSLKRLERRRRSFRDQTIYRPLSQSSPQKGEFLSVKSNWKGDAAQASALPLVLAALIGMLASGVALSAEYQMESANLPVRQRQHPEADPTGFAYEGIMFYPSVLAGMEFDSNIYASSQNASEDMALILAPELRISSDSEAVKHTFDLGASHRQYKSFDSENRTEAHARLTSARQFTTDVRLDTLFEAARKFEARGSSITVPDAAKPIAYRDLRAETTVTKTFNRLGVAVGGGIRSLAFEDGETFSGAPLEQGFRDGTIITASVKPFYEISPGYRAYSLLKVNRRDYEGTGSLDRDSEGYDARAGLEFLLTSMLFGSVDLGYLKQNYSNPLIPNAVGLSTKANLNWLMTPLMTVSLFGSRQVAELAAQDQEARIDLTVGARVDYELRRNLIATVEGSYTNEDFTGNNREDNVFNISTQIDYMMNAYCSFGLKYSYFERNSNNADFSFDRHLVMLNVTAQY
jgi:hypothetical protein